MHTVSAALANGGGFHRRFAIPGVLLLSAALLVGGAAIGQTAVPAATTGGGLTTVSPPQQIDVLMQDSFFDPQAVTVATGGTVTWRNAGRFGHNAASVFPDQIFGGPRILTGGSFSHTFTSPDVYHYECVFHAGMLGTITVITDGAPAAPEIGQATVGIGSATVMWTPPVGTPGSPVVGYRVRVDTGLGAFVRDVEVPDPQATQTVVMDLRRGAAYRFEVAALNDVGQSLFSELSRVVVTPRPPFAPRIARAAPGAAGGARTAIARWRRPLNTGGTAITGYVVTALRVTRSHHVAGRVRSPVLPATARSRVFRLAPGHYRFVVAARNAVSTGVRSDRSNVVAPR
jgi:plastocyanin